MKPKCFVPDLKLFLHEQFNNFLNKSKRTLINLEISPCGVCNANCSFCFYGKNKDKEFLQVEDLLNLLRRAKDGYGLKAITWTGGGEPTLHTGFDTMIQQVYFNLGIKQGLFTNALDLPTYDASVFEWIRISKTDRDWNQDAIRLICAGAEKVGLCINFVGDEDLDSIAQAISITERHDAIKYVQVRPALGTNGEESGVKITEKLSEYAKEPKVFITDYKFEKANNKDRGYDKCYGYHFVPFLWHNGDFGCCGYQREIVFGNIYKDSMDDIMNNMPDFVNVRTDCQLCCKNSEINESINKIVEIEDKDFV